MNADALTWLRWFHEAEDALVIAITNEVRMWLREQSLSEGMREAIDRTRCARLRWEERLTAYNAFVDYLRRSEGQDAQAPTLTA